MLVNIAKLIQNGYVEDMSVFPVYWIYEIRNKKSLSGSIVMFCPTYVHRGSFEILDDLTDHLISQIRQIHKKHAPQITIVIGIQYQGDLEKEEGIFRLSKLREKFDEVSISFSGFIQYGRGKIHSLNVAINFANEIESEGLLQVDDDVRFEDGSLANLIDAYYEKKIKAVCGARKKVISKKGMASRLLKYAKAQVKSPITYPHACCMIFNPKLFKGGIPTRYVSDDGYVCFKTIDPNSKNPVENLVIVENCICWFVSGGPTKEIIKRIRRIMLTHVILLVDFPIATSKFFLKNILFSGFWPISKIKRNGSFLGTLSRYVFQCAYFIWLIVIGVELMIRGGLGIPIREISWNAITQYQSPSIDEV